MADGKLHVTGSAAGRVVEIADWDGREFKIYDNLDPTPRKGPAGSWERTGLVLNDVDFFAGSWYATSYFTEAYASGTDPDRNKFIRFPPVSRTKGDGKREVFPAGDVGCGAAPYPARSMPTLPTP